MTSQEEMIAEFQCPGCTSGCAPPAECEWYKLKEEGQQFSCRNHSAGTIISGIGSIYLGMPKGFDRVGAICPKLGDPENFRHNIRLFLSKDGIVHGWNFCNVPVWVMEKDGFLFVRTYMPRLNGSFIDVIKGAKKSDFPALEKALDVATFIDDID